MYLKTVFNLLVTLLMWLYFTVGFVLLFSPLYLWAYFFSKNREVAFQHLNHYFFRGFFFLLKRLTPSVKWRFPKEIETIQSSVVVCNHLSYLDPLLLISLFPRQKTIVKGTFFKVPLFGWMIKQSGSIPANAQGSLTALTIERIEAMEDYLSSGGNLFIFPEGTRSRDGGVGPFSKGAFKIARRCHAPIQVLKIRGTGKLFVPGKFLFNAHITAAITVEKLATLPPDDGDGRVSISATMTKVRSLLSA